MDFLLNIIREYDPRLYEKIWTWKRTHINRTPPKERQRWTRAQGEKTYRILYPLTSNSIVFDVGGYEGGWAAKIDEMYGCSIHVFEPIPQFSKAISEKFKDKRNIIVNTFGLGGKDTTCTISLNQDASSTLVASSLEQKNISIQIKNVAEYINAHDIPQIDLMKLNIEGGEYDVIPSLYEHGLLPRIKNLQVQFHDFIEDAEEKLMKCRKMLGETHKMDWCFKYVFESWSVK